MSAVVFLVILVAILDGGQADNANNNIIFEDPQRSANVTIVTAVFRRLDRIEVQSETEGVRELSQHRVVS